MQRISLFFLFTWHRVLSHQMWNINSFWFSVIYTRVDSKVISFLVNLYFTKMMKNKYFHFNSEFKSFDIKNYRFLIIKSARQPQSVLWFFLTIDKSHVHTCLTISSFGPPSYCPNRRPLSSCRIFPGFDVFIFWWRRILKIAI